MFRWKKLGNIFCPENNYPWMISHAANPFPVFIDDEQVKIYFTSRDKLNRSHIGFAIFNFNNNFEILSHSEIPVVEPGNPGEFDDSGAAMGFYLEHEEKKYIYYLGWNLKVTVPWQNSIGLAIASTGSDQFLKFSPAPIMDRNREDPFSISYPCILIEDGKFKMWYGSNLSWGVNQDQMNHVIKYAESSDGINWIRLNHICINLKFPNEYAVSKPCVLKIDGLYRMWYSYRGNKEIINYRIGYAESSDGLNWIRQDEKSGIDVSLTGWDSDMICYPYIFPYRNKFYMLYNGNGFGKTGFGLAIAEQTKSSI